MLYEVITYNDMTQIDSRKVYKSGNYRIDKVKVPLKQRVIQKQVALKARHDQKQQARARKQLQHDQDKQARRQHRLLQRDADEVEAKLEKLPFANLPESLEEATGRFASSGIPLSYQYSIG